MTNKKCTILYFSALHVNSFILTRQHYSHNSAVILTKHENTKWQLAAISKNLSNCLISTILKNTGVQDIF